MGISYRAYFSYDGADLSFDFNLKSSLRFLKIKADRENGFRVTTLWGLIQLYPKKEKKGSESNRKKNASKEQKFDLKKLLSADTRAGIVILYNLVKPLIIKLKPRIEESSFHFSCGEPDLTGMTLGLVSMIPVTMQGKSDIDADFDSEEPYFRGHISVIGKLSTLAFIGVVRDLLRNKLVKSILGL